MGKKVKCIECQNCMRFAIPNKRTLMESMYVENTVRNYLCCGYNMTKHSVKFDHEQQCKHYIKADDSHLNFNSQERQNQLIDEVLGEIKK